MRRSPSTGPTLPWGRRLRTFQRRLLEWFQKEKRTLPWRKTRDAYRIWISEVMLQQTRVAAVLPYYQRFLERFPTARALARAPQEHVLEAWAGLGYYSRARNLQRAAQQMLRKHGGKFPRTLEDALALPGVGRYTAGAVLSMAYGVPLAALDGNVARVVARLGAVRGDLRRPAMWRQLEAAAATLLPASALGAPGDWNQAMMELGATVCTPATPSCTSCPATFCRARALGLQHTIPQKRAKPAAVDVRLAAAVLLDPQRRTLLVRRGVRLDDVPSDEHLFSRMWQFPAVRVANGDASELRRHLRDDLGIDATECLTLPAARHTVTFHRITLLPFLVPVEVLPALWRTGSERGESIHVPLEEVSRWPTSSATRKIARAGLRSGQSSLPFSA